jgi:hypothetical protein
MLDCLSSLPVPAIDSGPVSLLRVVLDKDRLAERNPGRGVPGCLSSCVRLLAPAIGPIPTPVSSGFSAFAVGHW